MKFRVLVAAAIATLAVGVAHAADIESGKIYTADEIRAFTVSGIHLGQTADEAGKALKEAGYEGKFDPIDPNNFTRGLSPKLRNLLDVESVL